MFNWLFARHHGGRFLLRIEDTDRQRSTDEAIAAIFDGLGWLGLDWDEAPVFQFQRAPRHVARVEELLAAGKAYRCWCTPAELDEMRARARAEKRPIRYDGTWRDRDPATAPAGVDPVVRFRAPQGGETTIDDIVQGEVKVANDQLDDMILLRADGNPTYMLSVVIDDIDMGITHVIRGDDHLTNAFRQNQLYLALGATPPRFGHIPLIHGSDGAKLSKRHGALGVDAYRDMGFLPAAMRNYLMRLGWSHGDDETISTEQAVTWFDGTALGRSPSRFDMAKLTSINADYIRATPDTNLAKLLTPWFAKAGIVVDAVGEQRLALGMDGLKQRARTLIELADMASFYVQPRPLPVNEAARKLLDDTARAAIAEAGKRLAGLEAWEQATLEEACRAVAAQLDLGFGKLAQPLRSALTGTTVSPGLFDVMVVLGRDETLARIDDAAAGRNPVKPETTS